MKYLVILLTLLCLFIPVLTYAHPKIQAKMVKAVMETIKENHITYSKIDFEIKYNPYPLHGEFFMDVSIYDASDIVLANKIHKKLSHNYLNYRFTWASWKAENGIEKIEKDGEVLWNLYFQLFWFPEGNIIKW